MPELLAAIRREVDLLNRFTQILHREQEALKLGSALILPALIQDKAVLIEELNTVATQRNALLMHMDCGKDKAGMSNWLRAHPNEKTTQQIWTKLLLIAEEARQLNQVNGKLITLRLQSTQEALATLSHQAKQNTLYGSDGQTTSLTGYRIIDSA